MGHGAIGRRHAAHILAQPEAVLAGVCDVDSTRLRDLPPEVAVFTDLNHMLQACPADVLCVCTPNYLHEAHAVAGLQIGLHVVVEKPMALSTESATRIIEAAQQAGRTAFAVKQNRYNAPVQHVKALLDQGAMGELILVQVSGLWNRSDRYYAESPWRGKRNLDGGPLFTQFSHFVDILLYLAGPMDDAMGAAANFAHMHNTETDDTGAFVLRSRRGAIVSFSYTTCATGGNMEGAITLVGTRGTVRIGGQYLNTLEYAAGVPAMENLPASNNSLPNQYGHYQGSMSNHDRVIQNVVDVLRGRDMAMTSAEEGREVVRTIELMYAAVRAGYGFPPGLSGQIATTSGPSSTMP